MADEITIVVRADDQFSSVLGNFGSIITGIESAINLVGQAFDAAADFIGQFVDSASEGEQAVARLEGILRATGGAAGLTSEEIQDMAGALQSVTRFSDETILAGTSLLLTFRNIGDETMARAIPAMLDMAEIFGSVDSAAMQLGKALNEPTTMLGSLTRAGVTFSEEQKEMIANFVEMGDLASAQAIILGEVEAQVGGLARTMGETFAGQWEIARNRIDELAETIGGAFLPVLGDLFGRLSDFAASPQVQQFVVDFAERLSAGLAELTPLFDSFMGTLQEVFALVSTGDFAGLWDMVLGGINDVDWEQVSRDLAEGLRSIDWGVVSEGVGDISSVFTEILTEIDWSAVAGAVWESLIQAFTVVIDNGANALIELLADVFGDPDVATFQAGVQAGAARLGDILLTTLFPPSLGFQLADQMREIAGDMIDGLWAGWSSAFNSLGLGGIASWWEDHVIEPIKDILGISSPSTVFMGIGRDIILGFIAGLQGAIGGVLSVFQSLISQIRNLPGWGEVVDFLDGSSGGTTGGATGGAGGVGAGGGGLGGGSAEMPGGGPGGSNTGIPEGATSVVFNFYGSVTINGMPGEGEYDCPPNIIISGTSNQLVTSGIG